MTVGSSEAAEMGPRRDHHSDDHPISPAGLSVSGDRLTCSHRALPRPAVRRSLTSWWELEARLWLNAGPSILTPASCSLD